VSEPEPETILEEAQRLVAGARGASYGHPLDNHQATADLMAVYLRRKYGVQLPLDADDTCWFNIFQKASRDANAPKRDNLVDAAGYAHNIDLCRQEREARADAAKVVGR
jgi:hypothetical protein